MKSILLATVFFGACMAQAANQVEGGNVATWVEVDYSTATKTTLIAVPVDALNITGATNTTAVLSTFLPPADYATGTAVYLYNAAAKSYYTWRVASGEEGGNVWNPDEYTFAGQGENFEVPTANQQQIKAGTALWLELPELSTGSTFISGQPTSLSSIGISAGHNLVAFGGTEAVALTSIKVNADDIGSIATPATLYRMTLPQATGLNATYVYLGTDEDGAKWLDGKGQRVTNVSIPAGKGFWIIAPAGSAETTLTTL